MYKINKKEILKIRSWPKFRKSRSPVLHKGQLGFTLLELLIAISLLAITAGLTGDILLTLVRTYNKTRITNEIEQNGNLALSKIEKELRTATNLIEPDPECLGGPACNCSNVLEFERMSLQDPNDESDDTLVTIRYEITSSGSLERTENINTTSRTTSSILLDPNNSHVMLDTSQSEFCAVEITSPKVIEINFTLLQDSSQGGVSFAGTVDLNQVIVLRGTY